MALKTPASLLEIRADVTDLRPASLWLEQQATARDIPPDQIFRLDLCLNEALANVIEHGGHEASQAPVRLSLGSAVESDSAHATLMISDAGRAFNPLAAAPKAQPDSLADATPGGLGLGLMTCFADEVAYEHLHDRNCLQFVVRWSTDQ
ncbi:MAG: ATP-binding protein [Rhodoferax sp.]|jgi:anti-sigma regulatory factor (Ser/Thr protein kinase)|uniref:ATP-binding protein n=1 Tax=Rhodoferax sp. TaxID=50421 RepID=UPI003BAE8857